MDIIALFKAAGSNLTPEQERRMTSVANIIVDHQKALLEGKVELQSYKSSACSQKFGKHGHDNPVYIRSEPLQMNVWEHEFLDQLVIDLTISAVDTAMAQSDDERCRLVAEALIGLKRFRSKVGPEFSLLLSNIEIFTWALVLEDLPSQLPSNWSNALKKMLILDGYSELLVKEGCFDEDNRLYVGTSHVGPKISENPEFEEFELEKESEGDAPDAELHLTTGDYESTSSSWDIVNAAAFKKWRSWMEWRKQGDASVTMRSPPACDDGQSQE